MFPTTPPPTLFFVQCCHPGGVLLSQLHNMLARLPLYSVFRCWEFLAAVAHCHMDRGAIDAKPALRLAAPSTMHYMHVSSFISYGSYACTPILDARCCVRTRAHHCPIRLHGCGDKHPFSGCSPGRLADAWPGWKPLAGRGRSPHVKGQGGVATFNGTLLRSHLCSSLSHSSPWLW